MTLVRLTAYLGLLALTACTGATAETGDTSGTTTGAAPQDMDPPGPAGCKRSVLEVDFKTVAPLGGAGVDPATGALGPLPEGAIVSSTYLALRGEEVAQKRFGELMGPLAQALSTQPGLLAMQLATSASCGTARTLTVWKDEVSMLTFVSGSAHSAAISATSEVSRGGSVVTSWDAASAEDATWEMAVKNLDETYGPYY